MSDVEENKHYQTAGGIDVRTSVFVSTYNFKWNVENVSKLLGDVTVQSPPFHPIPDSEWYATLEKTKVTKCIESPLVGFSFGAPTLMCHNSQEEDKHHFLLQFCKTKGSKIGIKFVVSILDCNKQSFYNNSNFKIFNTGEDSLLFETPNTIQEKLMTACNDVLIFVCDMEIHGHGMRTDAFENFPEPKRPSRDNLSELSNSLKIMYGVSMYTDVTLRAGGSVIQAHKSVLSARSPVFARMFQTAMGESERNTIDIVDLDLPVLKKLVAFLYTGTLNDEDFEVLYHLYYAADKYDVSSLRKTCADLLLSKMEVDSACRLLVLADLHSHAYFKESVMKFIKFEFEKVLETDGWEEMTLDATQLAAEVMNLRGKKRKEE